jgi:hypothetical protein
MVTFNDARRIVGTYLEEVWRDGWGTLYVAADGWEDGASWRVEAGSREDLVDRDLAYEVTPGAVYLVDKVSGALVIQPPHEVMSRVAQMTPVKD